MGADLIILNVSLIIIREAYFFKYFIFSFILLYLVLDNWYLLIFIIYYILYFSLSRRLDFYFF